MSLQPPLGRCSSGREARQAPRRGPLSAIRTRHGRPRLAPTGPAFAAVGVFGFVVDFGLTYALVRGFDLDPLIARLPAFAVATVLNFALNRALTFAGSRAPLLGGVRALLPGLRRRARGQLDAPTRWRSPRRTRFCLPTPPEALPIFVAFGTGVAMFVTFFGFKRFAFRA